jgi:hypothetical protein
MDRSVSDSGDRVVALSSRRASDPVVPDERITALLERRARCVYMIGRHREGIRLNAQRLDEIEAELARIRGLRA